MTHRRCFLLSLLGHFEDFACWVFVADLLESLHSFLALTLHCFVSLSFHLRKMSHPTLSSCLVASCVSALLMEFYGESHSCRWNKGRGKKRIQLSATVARTNRGKDTTHAQSQRIDTIQQNPSSLFSHLSGLGKLRTSALVGTTGDKPSDRKLT